MGTLSSDDELTTRVSSIVWTSPSELNPVAGHAGCCWESEEETENEVELSMMADGLDWCINTNPEVRLITSEEAHPGRYR